MWFMMMQIEVRWYFADIYIYSVDRKYKYDKLTTIISIPKLL